MTTIFRTQHHFQKTAKQCLCIIIETYANHQFMFKKIVGFTGLSSESLDKSKLRQLKDECVITSNLKTTWTPVSGCPGCHCAAHRPVGSQNRKPNLSGLEASSPRTPWLPGWLLSHFSHQRPLSHCVRTQAFLAAHTPQSSSSENTDHAGLSYTQNKPFRFISNVITSLGFIQTSAHFKVGLLHTGKKTHSSSLSVLPSAPRSLFFSYTKHIHPSHQP